MHYYRNYELANLYHVSKPTVAKWLDGARKGTLDLQTTDVDGKSYISNTPKNHAAIRRLIKERKKYLNSRSLKTVTPKPEFYSLYTPEQVADIISSLERHREIPRQYNYMDAGAAFWDTYATQLFNDDETPNPIHETEQLLLANQAYLDGLLSNFTQVNVVDIGPGNGLPVKNLLSHLLERGILGRYTAIDISPEMLEIARRNIKEWFGDKVAFEADLRDINYERFTDLLVRSSPDDGSINLVLFFGCTLHNLRSPEDALRTIYNSMSPPDLLICPLKLDTPATRQNFHFVEGAENQPLPPQYKFLVDQLGIEPSLYDVEMGFDAEAKMRYLQIRLKVALSIHFQVNGIERPVSLNKGDALLVWRSWHQSALEIFSQFERNGFGVLQTSQTEDHDCMLTICDIRAER